VTEIRSYRRVFDLERRIYSVDRLRLNPGGVPVRGVVYFLAILSAATIAARLPLLGALARELPWCLRDLALPVAAAAVLSAIRIEGRVFHLAAHALVRYWVGPRRLAGTRRCRSVGERWRPGEIVILPDGSDGRLRGLRYTGPGAVLVSVEHERRGRANERGASARARPGLAPVLNLSQPAAVRPLREREVISLAPGARMRVRSNPAQVR
jgi:hypothetical protein